jgi:hypothetical protein
MLISDLIEQLQSVLVNKGDLPVVAFNLDGEVHADPDMAVLDLSYMKRELLVTNMRYLAAEIGQGSDPDVVFIYRP